MIPLNASVKLLRVNFPKHGNFILYFQQQLIILNDFRGRVSYSGDTLCLVNFPYPSSFPFSRNYTFDGLITLWVKHEDLLLVSYNFRKPVVDDV
jgi:hypothetical protein